LIKSGIVDYSTKQKLILKSPFHVVQLWAWERFSKLSPQPRVINSTEPRSARWHQVNGLDGVQNWRRVLDLVVEPDFKWRPYAKISENMHVPGYYLNKEKWVVVGPALDNELLTFAMPRPESETNIILKYDVRIRSASKILKQ
jgi:hypothetical protein